MTIFHILCAGTLAELVCVLIRPLSGNGRGLVCWTIASLCTVLASVVFFAGSGRLVPDLELMAPAAAGLGAVTAIILLIELCAPSKRFHRVKTEYDSRIAEDCLNLVLAIVASVLAAAAVFFVLVMGREALCGICLIPAAAVSLRQLSYFLYRAKLDSAAEKDDSRRRESLIRSLRSGRRGL